MGKLSRRKGQRGELRVAHALQVVFPEAARDLNDVNDEQGVDLKNTGNLAVQVKHYKNHVPLSKFNEIKPEDGRIRVLVSWPTDRKSEPLVVLTLEDFIKMVQDISIVGVNHDA